MELNLPTAEEIKAAWRRIARAAQPPREPPAPEPPAPEPPAPESPPEPPACEPLCSRAQEYAAMAMSKEAALVIRTAYHVLDLSRGAEEPDPCFDAQLEMMQVVFKHALLRLQAAYPGEFSGFSKNSHGQVVDWSVRLYACGQKVPAAVAAAEEVGYNLTGAAAEFLLWREAHRPASEPRHGNAAGLASASVMVYWCNDMFAWALLMCIAFIRRTRKSAPRSAG